MKPVFFKSQAEFRKWLEKNYKTKTEILVGYHKVKTGKPSLTWSESVDQALCFGWIDGIRRSINEEGYCIRFTPRKPTSNWSGINIKKVEELSKKGLMKQEGLDAFNSRKSSRSDTYSYENKPAGLSDDLEDIFRKNKEAWDYFCTLPPYLKKTVTYWIMSAKQEKTRLVRLNKIIERSENKNVKLQ